MIDVINELKYGTLVDVYDPWCDASEAMTEYKIRLTENLEMSTMMACLCVLPMMISNRWGLRRLSLFVEMNT